MEQAKLQPFKNSILITPDKMIMIFFIFFIWFFLRGGGGAIFSDKQPTSVFCQKGYKSIYRTNTNVVYRTIMYTYTKIDEKRTIS